jgi:hypothetical protein
VRAGVFFHNLLGRRFARGPVSVGIVAHDPRCSRKSCSPRCFRFGDRIFSYLVTCALDSGWVSWHSPARYFRFRRLLTCAIGATLCLAFI